MCLQALDKTHDAPEGGFKCGPGGLCAKQKAQGAAGDAEVCGLYCLCSVSSPAPLSGRTRCCNKPCHLLCTSVQCFRCRSAENDDNDNGAEGLREPEEEDEVRVGVGVALWRCGGGTSAGGRSGGHFGLHAAAIKCKKLVVGPKSERQEKLLIVYALYVLYNEYTLVGIELRS